MPVPTLIRPPVLLITPAKVVELLLPPTVSVLLVPRLTVDPAAPAKEPTVVPAALIPEMSKAEPLAEALTAVEEERAPEPLRANVPPEIVVAPV